MLVDRPTIAAVEHALAESARHYARVKAAVDPDGGASFIDVAGGAVVDGGRDSGPNLGRAWGMGIDTVIDDAALDQIEQFDAALQRPSRIVLSPFVSDDCLQRVVGRGYRIERYEAVLAAPVDVAVSAASDSPLTIEPIDKASLEQFWSVYESIVGDLALTNESIQRLNAPFFVSPCQAFMGHEGDRAVAAAAVTVSASVGHLLAAVVKIEARGRGFQRALIAARAAWSKAHGASLVMATCAPGSASFLNLQRAGMRLIATSPVLLR